MILFGEWQLCPPFAKPQTPHRRKCTRVKADSTPRTTISKRLRARALRFVLLDRNDGVEHAHRLVVVREAVSRAGWAVDELVARFDNRPKDAVGDAPGFLVGSGMDPELRGFLHAEPGARLQKMAHTGALILRHVLRSN